MNWTFAGAVSLALHAVVLLLFAWSGGESAPRAACDPEKDVSAPAATEAPQSVKPSAESEPQPKAEPKSKAEPQPKVEPKPKAEVKPKAEEKSKAREPEREAPPVAVETYVVRKGDMLAHIAQDRNCTIQELAKLNGTTAKKLANLRVGQKIKVPRKGE